MNSINQIYHVARCGSTLMGALLSTVVPTYLEPVDGIKITNTGIVKEKYFNTVIKFQSLSLLNPILLEGKKVFLYRPLLHHLFKIKSDKIWLKNRANTIRFIVKKEQLLEWNPKTDLEFIAYHWICSINEMNKHLDVLWIQSNEFFENKKNIMDKVCDHFALNRIKDFSLTNRNVKKLKLLGKEEPCNIEVEINLNPVKDDYGIVKNTECYKDNEIIELVKEVENLTSSYTLIKKFLY